MKRAYRFVYGSSHLAYSPITGHFFLIEPEYEKAFFDVMEKNLKTEECGDEKLKEIIELFPQKKIRMTSGQLREKLKDLIWNGELGRMTFVLTRECNLRCKYCYENNAAACATESPEKEMDISDAARFIGEIKKIYKRVNAIMFFGGEPFLKKKLMKQIIDIIEAEKERDPAFGGGYSVITNGTLMDDDAISLIKKYNMGVTISCDGPPEINDKWRICRDGRGSWAKIRACGELLKKNNIGYTIQSTVTPDAVDSNVAIWDIANHFKGWGVNCPHIVHAQLASRLVGWDEARTSKLIDSYISSIRKNMAAIKNDELDQVGLFSRFTVLLEHLIGKRASMFRCPAGSELALSPDGMILPCFMFMGNEGASLASVGDFSAEGFIDRLCDFLLKNIKVLNHECDDCWAIALCNGCMGSNYAILNDFERNDPVNCMIIKACAETIMGELALLQQNQDDWKAFSENCRKLMARLAKNQPC